MGQICTGVDREQLPGLIPSDVNVAPMLQQLHTTKLLKLEYRVVGNTNSQSGGSCKKYKCKTPAMGSCCGLLPAAPGTQPNAQAHNPGGFRSILGTAGTTRDVPVDLPCKGHTVLLRRVRNVSCSSHCWAAARFGDFPKIFQPKKALSPFF